ITSTLTSLNSSPCNVGTLLYAFPLFFDTQMLAHPSNGCKAQKKLQAGAAGRGSGLASMDEGEEFVARLLALAECAQHGASHRGRVLLFHATHHHTKMPRLDDHAHAFRAQVLLDGLRDLARQPLLNLQPPRVHIHQSRNLAQSDHAL